MRFFTEEDKGVMFRLAKAHEPFTEHVTPDMFLARIADQEGWIFEDDGQLVGYLTLSTFQPLHSALIHATIRPEYRGLWIGMSNLRAVFGHLFNGDCLDLEKVYAYAVVGETYPAAKLLDSLGFQREGLDRRGLKLVDGRVFDLVRYGMLREECPWIKPRSEIRQWLKARRTRVH
jgi:RimJ/RimL family protein N-acetyltransferase